MKLLLSFEMNGGGGGGEKNSKYDSFSPKESIFILFFILF